MFVIHIPKGTILNN